MTLMNWFNYLSLLIFTPLKILELVKMARLMPKRKMRQNLVITYKSYNYVSNNLLNALLLFYY